MSGFRKFLQRMLLSVFFIGFSMSFGDSGGEGGDGPSGGSDVGSDAGDSDNTGDFADTPDADDTGDFVDTPDSDNNGDFADSPHVDSTMNSDNTGDFADTPDADDTGDFVDTPDTDNNGDYADSPHVDSTMTDVHGGEDITVQEENPQEENPQEEKAPEEKTQEEKTQEEKTQEDKTQEQKNQEEKSESPTVTHIKSRNEALEGQNHPETNVPFERVQINVDGKEYDVVVPRFESEFNAQLDPELFQAKDAKQFEECNRQLREEVDKNDELSSKFDEEQLDQIRNGETPDGFTWHHDAEAGRMQLVDSDIHAATGHTGGRNIWGGGTNNR